MCAIFDVAGLWLAEPVAAQNSLSTDSLRAVLAAHPEEDSSRVNTLSDLSAEYWNRDLDTAFALAQDALRLWERLAYTSGLGKAYNSMGVVRWYQGNYAEAQRHLELALKAQEATGRKNEMKGSLP